MSNGGGDGRDDSVLGTTLNHGVETSTGECSVGASEGLGGLELSFEIGLDLDGAIALGRAVVEALEGGRSRGERSRKGDETEATHVGCLVVGCKARKDIRKKSSAMYCRSVKEKKACRRWMLVKEERMWV